MSRYVFTERSSLRGLLFILAAIIVILLTIGTFFYHIVEGWSYMDAFYFSSISLSTRGYGELHPTKALSYIFTVFYLFLGVAFILYALSNFVGYYIQYHEPTLRKKMDSFVNTIVPQKRDKWVVIKSKKSLDEQFPFLKK